MVDVLVMKKPRSGRAPVSPDQISRADSWQRRRRSQWICAHCCRCCRVKIHQCLVRPMLPVKKKKKKKRNTRRQFESSRRLLAARSRFAVWDAKTNFKMRRWLTASGWREAGVHKTEPGRENVSVFSLQCWIQCEYQGMSSFHVCYDKEEKMTCERGVSVFYALRDLNSWQISCSK